MKNVRAKALRSLAAIAKAVVGEGDVGSYVVLSVVFVKRDRPQHVDKQLHSRQGCSWGSIHGSSCFLGCRSFLVSFACVLSGV